MNAVPSIAIIGSGALGGFLGAHLAHAGHSVHFLVRSDYEVLKKRGLRVEHTGADPIEVKQPRLYRTTIEIGPVDLVLVALKTTQNEVLDELLPPLAHSETVFLTVQNGLGNVETLARIFPQHPIIAGLCQIGVNRVAPGHLQSYVPGGGFVQVGAGPRANRTLVAQISALLSKSGIRTRELALLGEALWRKLMWNVPYNGLTVAAGGIATDAIVADPSLNAVTRGLMEELRTTAGVLGFPIEAAYTDKLIEFTAALGPYRPSSLIDWEAGRPLEVKAIWGEPLRQGVAKGLALPHLATLHAILLMMNRMRSAPSAQIEQS